MEKALACADANYRGVCEMKNKLFLMVFATVVLAIGIVAVGCASAPKESPIAQESPVALESNGSPITPKLDELLRKYAGPRLGNSDNKVTYYYFLNHLRFEEFKYELDAEGEYTQSSSWPEDRDKERGMTLARWVVRPRSLWDFGGSPGMGQL